MLERMKDHTGKTHEARTVATRQTDEDSYTGLWYQVEGIIDGEPVLLTAPVAPENLTGAHLDMLRSVQRYLDGQHHPTQYTGRLAYLAIPEPEPQPQPRQHAPECQCSACYYGPDAAKWLFNPSEY